MRIIAGIAHDLFLDLHDFDVELFWPGFETESGPLMLRKQQAQAELWLRARPGGYADKIVLHLRSGSGDIPRVLGIHRDPPPAPATGGAEYRVARPRHPQQSGEDGRGGAR